MKALKPNLLVSVSSVRGAIIVDDPNDELQVGTRPYSEDANVIELLIQGAGDAFAE